MYVLGKCVRDLGDITTTRLVFVISGGWKPATPSVVGSWFDHQPSRWQASAVAPTNDGAVLAANLDCTGIGAYYEITQGGNTTQLIADGEKIADLDGNNPVQNERVAFVFKMLDGLKQRHVELVATNAAKAKASYFLLTK